MSTRFVDGRSYFEAVADALEKAKEEIYITDWWWVAGVVVFFHLSECLAASVIVITFLVI